MSSSSTSRRTEETEAFADLLTEVLTRWMRECGALDAATGAAIEPRVVSRGPRQQPHWIESFAAQRLPGVSLRRYVGRLVGYMKCTPECFVMALCFLRRLMRKHCTPLRAPAAGQQPSGPVGAASSSATSSFAAAGCDHRCSPLTDLCGAPVLNMFTVYRLLSTALVIAAKSHDDHYFTMSYYAQVCGVSVAELLHMEARLLLSCNGLACQAIVGRQEYLLMLHKHMLRNSADAAIACGLYERGGGGGSTTPPAPLAMTALSQQQRMRPPGEWCGSGGAAAAAPLSLRHAPGTVLEPASHTTSPQPAGRTTAGWSARASAASSQQVSPASVAAAAAAAEYGVCKEGLDDADADAEDLQLISGGGTATPTPGHPARQLRASRDASSRHSLDDLDDARPVENPLLQLQRGGAAAATAATTPRGGGGLLAVPTLSAAAVAAPPRAAAAAGSRRGSGGDGGGAGAAAAMAIARGGGMSGVSSASSLCGMSAQFNTSTTTAASNGGGAPQPRRVAPPLPSAPPVPAWMQKLRLFYASPTSPVGALWADL